MYIPAPFAETRLGVLHAFIDAHPFATLVSTGAKAGLVATHLPLLLDPSRGPYGTLVGHVARPNPQAGDLADGASVLALFHGPHAYVSPRWYETRPAVPTWNYAAVHGYGEARLIEDPAAVRAMLQDIVARFEPAASDDAGEGGWRAEALPEKYFSSMAAGVVGFEIELSRLEGKFKLNQNRSAADQAGVVAALNTGDFEAKAVAALMSDSARADTGRR
jgi:transcriptional regulator